jgi:SAM-dependent methyltransferase
MKGSVRRVLHDIYRSLPRPPSTNYETGQFNSDFINELSDASIVLDLGAKASRCKAVLGRELPGYLSTDIAFDSSLDFLSDAHAIPLRSESIDAVLCVSVLMYCENPFVVLDEMLRILKPGGVIYVNTPFVYRAAKDPDDYYRFSASGLRKLCQSFEVIQSGFSRGPASTMADMLSHFCAVLFSFNSKAIHSVLLDFFQWCFFWMKYCDRVIAGYRMAEVIHSGAFFVGRKPSVPRAITSGHHALRSNK